MLLDLYMKVTIQQLNLVLFDKQESLYCNDNKIVL